MDIAGPIRIIWDDTDTFNFFPKVAQVKAGQEEFKLLFGTTKRDQPVPGELRVDLLDQVVLNPFAAKRLSNQLAQVIREYETAHGPLLTDPPPRDRETSSGLLPTFKSPVTNEKVGLLFGLLNDLHLRVAFERSLKISEKMLDGSRFLVGINRHTISRTRNKSIVDVCVKLGMPENFQEAFKENLKEATVFGFGIDEKKEGCVLKAYLEFGARYEETMKKPKNRRDPYIANLGFKWDAQNSSQCVLTKYTCFPSFSLREMLERVSHHFHGENDSNSYDIMEHVVEVASKKADADKFIYLEAGEENNPRSSFDLNVYAADLRMRDVYPLLWEMCLQYSIPEEKFQTFYEPIKDLFFGHISGGMDRNGKDFLTVYFGK